MKILTYLKVFTFLTIGVLLLPFFFLITLWYEREDRKPRKSPMKYSVFNNP